MSGPETVAVIRDLSIITAAVVFIGVFVPAGIMYFRLYRSLARTAENLEGISSAVKNGLVRPLSSLSGVMELIDRIVGLVQRRRAPERSDTDG